MKEHQMAAYYVSVMEVHPDGDITKNSSKYVFGPKQYLEVKDANEAEKAKREEYHMMVVDITQENPEGIRVPNPKGKIQFQISRERY
jgi:hypothetical protein